MTLQSSGNDKEVEVTNVPRRDWIVLPLLAVVTVCVLAGTTEFVARQVFSASKTGMANCLVLDDPTTGARGIPNSVCWEKGSEDQWTEFRFNRCGHRAGMECGPKPPGTYRIVMMGSSVAMGERVRREDTLAALLPPELSQATGRKVEVYNEGMGWGFSHSTALRFNQVLAEDPDLILWTLTPMDVERASDVVPTNDRDPEPNLSLPRKAWRRMRAAFSGGSMSAGASEVFSRTRSALMLRHFLYQSQSQYVKSALAGPDSSVGFLKSDLSPLWTERLAKFNLDAADMEDRARAAGIPFVAVLLPEREQAAMISMGEWPSGYDPYELDHAVESIIRSHGGIYLDILPGFRTIANPEKYYLPVDGHPAAGGHAIFARLLAKELTSGAVPALKAPAQQSTAALQAK